MTGINPYQTPKSDLERSQEEPVEVVNPFFSMWHKPRATMRYVMTTMLAHKVHRLAMAGGLALALSEIRDQSLAGMAMQPALVIGAVVGGAVFGVIGLYVGSACLRWTGGWLGGSASTFDVRAAWSWSNIPVLWSLLLTIPMLVLPDATVVKAMAQPYGASSNPLTAIAAIEGIVLLWGFVVFLKCLGEVHKFSAWHALGAMLLSALLVLVPTGVAGYLFVSVLVGRVG